jgi:gluconate 2-dehydrogenase gamma chain
MSSNESDRNIPRRTFLKRVASATAVLPVATTLAAVEAGALAGAPQANAQTALSAVPAGYEFFSPAEAAFVETMVTVMCPADALTPNGVDCGLAVFIDRQLGGAFGRGDKLYMHGPWKAGKPQVGYQLPLTPAEFFRVGVEAAGAACQKKNGMSFDQLKPADADAFLKDLQANKVEDPRIPLAQWFNDLVYPLFVQACFADPIYGGNQDKVFWKMIGYPGLPSTHTRDVVDFRDKPFPGAKTPKSIADFS